MVVNTTRDEHTQSPATANRGIPCLQDNPETFVIDGEHVDRDKGAGQPDAKKKGMVSWLGYNTTDGEGMRSSDPPLAQAAALGEDSLMAFLDDIDEQQVTRRVRGFTWRIAPRNDNIHVYMTGQGLDVMHHTPQQQYKITCVHDGAAHSGREHLFATITRSAATRPNRRRNRAA